MGVIPTECVRECGPSGNDRPHTPSLRTNVALRQRRRLDYEQYARTIFRTFTPRLFFCGLQPQRNFKTKRKLFSVK